MVAGVPWAVAGSVGGAWSGRRSASAVADSLDSDMVLGAWVGVCDRPLTGSLVVGVGEVVAWTGGRSALAVAGRGEGGE